MSLPILLTCLLGLVFSLCPLTHRCPCQARGAVIPCWGWLREPGVKSTIPHALVREGVAAARSALGWY